MCPLDYVLALINKSANLIYLIEVGHYQKTTSCSGSYFEFFSTPVLLLSNQRFVICSTQTILVGENALHVAR